MDLLGWMFRARRARAEGDRRAEALTARITELETELAGTRKKLAEAEARTAPTALVEEIRKKDDRIREIEAAFAVRDADVDSLLLAHQRQLERIAEFESELGRREESVGDLRTRLAEARERIRRIQEGEAPATDELTRIQGIGPVLGKRFREAGILTFRRLAETPPEELLAAARLPAWSIANPDDWIRQARELAGGAGAPVQ